MTMNRYSNVLSAGKKCILAICMVASMAGSSLEASQTQKNVPQKNQPNEKSIRPVRKAASPQDVASWIDLCLLLLLLLGAFWGFRRGFVAQVIPCALTYLLYSKQSACLGVTHELMQKLYPGLSDHTAYIFGVGILVLGFFVLHWLLFEIWQALRMMIPRLLLPDRLLGILFGVVQIIVFLSFIVGVLHLTGFAFEESSVERTFIFKWLQHFTPKIMKWTEKLFPTLMSFLKRKLAT